MLCCLVSLPISLQGKIPLSSQGRWEETDEHSYDLYFIEVTIEGIKGWAEDGGTKLHDEEKGCGAMTGWQWSEARDGSLPEAYFLLPLFIKSGCVECLLDSCQEDVDLCPFF